MFWRRNSTLILVVLLAVEISCFYLVAKHLADNARDVDRSAEMARRNLIRENAMLRQALVRPTGATATDPKSDSGADLERLRDADVVEILRSSDFGAFAWTRTQDATLTDEIDHIARVLGLSSEQVAALRGAADEAERRLLSGMLERSSVRHPVLDASLEDPNDPLRTSDSLANASADEMRLIEAHRTVDAALRRGDRVVEFDLPASPDAQAIRTNLQQAFISIMGENKYELYRAVGAEAVIDDYLRKAGLEPQIVTVAARFDTTRNETTYDVRRIRTQGGQVVSGTRLPEGEGKVDFRILGARDVRTVLLNDGRSSLNGDSLRPWAGPLVDAFPAAFDKSGQ